MRSDKGRIVRDSASRLPEESLLMSIKVEHVEKSAHLSPANSSKSPVPVECLCASNK